MPEMLRAGEAGRKAPGQVCAAVVGVHDRDVPVLQIPHERRKDSSDCGGTRALVPTPVLYVIAYRGSLDVDALPPEDFGDRPLRIMQHHQGRVSRPVEIGYQAERRQMTSADIVAYKRKAHSRRF